MFNRAEQPLAKVYNIDDYRPKAVETVIEALPPLDEYAAATALAQQAESEPTERIAPLARFAARAAVLGAVIPLHPRMRRY
jgi:hypothetical protein